MQDGTPERRIVDESLVRIAEQLFHLRADGLDAEPVVVEDVHVHHRRERVRSIGRYRSSAWATRRQPSCRWIGGAQDRGRRPERRELFAAPVADARRNRRIRSTPHHSSPTKTGNSTNDTTPCNSSGGRSLSGKAATAPCTTSPSPRTSAHLPNPDSSHGAERKSGSSMTRRTPGAVHSASQVDDQPTLAVVPFVAMYARETSAASPQSAPDTSSAASRQSARRGGVRPRTRSPRRCHLDATTRRAPHVRCPRDLPLLPIVDRTELPGVAL